jgi:HSP20 family protein
MLTLWNDPWLRRGTDLGAALQAFDALSRSLGRLADLDAPGSFGPRIDLWDTDTALVLRAELPGFSQDDIKVTVENGILTISGKRRVEAPEGYAVHRRERRLWQFTRSFTLPCKVDPAGVQATLECGILELTLPKPPEAQPRRITIKGS